MVTWEWSEYDVDRAMSVQQVISTWTWLLTQGFYRVTDKSFWDADWERIPSFVRRTGLA